MDRGALLLEEPSEILVRRGRVVRKGAAILAALGLGLLTVAGALGWGAPGNRFATPLLFMGILLGPPLLALAALFLRASTRLKPIRFYENGIEGHPLVGDRSLFVSYGEVLAIEEAKVPLEGEVYRLRTALPAVMIGIPRDMPGAATILDHIRPRMGRPEFVVQVAAPASPATERFARFFPVIALAIAAVASVLVVGFTLPGGYGLADIVLLFGLVFAPFGMVAVTYAALRLPSMKKFIGPPPSVKLPAFLVAGLLMYGVANATLVTLETTGPPPVPEIGPRPDASALAPGTYENATLTVSGVVRVDAGEALSLRNVSLALAPLAGVDGGIWIAPGGHLTLENVTVRGAGARVTFEILGSAEILRSDLADLAGDPNKDHTDGGLEIYSSDVLLDGTSVHDTATNGIFVVGASPVIRNSSVVRAGDDGIEIQRSAARIENNTVTRCGWAMIVWVDSAPTIVGSRFANNDHGLHFTASGGRIENNTFDGNGAYAIRLTEGSDPSLAGNVFVTAADDVERATGFETSLLCGPIVAGIGIACLGALFWRHRKNRIQAAAPPPGT